MNKEDVLQDMKSPKFKHKYEGRERHAHNWSAWITHKETLCKAMQIMDQNPYHNFRQGALWKEQELVEFKCPTTVSQACHS